MNRMNRNVAAKPPPIVPGVIDSIADGLSLALARPLLLLLPMLLDAYYWLGWRVSLEALTDRVRGWTLDTNADGAGDVAEQLTKLGNADATWLLSMFMPSLLSEADGSSLYQLRARPLIRPDSWWIDLPLVVLLIAGATFLMMLYAVPIADAALNRGRSVRDTAAAILVAWWRLLGLLIACIGIALLMIGPFVVGSIALLLAGINPAPALGSIAVLAAFIAYLALWFAPDAIVVSQVGPLRAISYSVSMLRSYFWPAVGLGAASLLITIGLGELWRRLVDSAPGLLLGVIANSFFATGLAIASMSFYAHRIRVLKPDSVQ